MANYKRVVLTEKADYVNQAVNTGVEKQINSFDNSYTSKKLNDLYNEFDSITLKNTISETALESSVKVYQTTNQKLKTAVYLTMAISVTLLMAFLAIYNIFVINSLNGGINILQEDVATAQVDLNNLNNLNNSLFEMSEQEIKDLLAAQLGGNYVDQNQNAVVDVDVLPLTNNTTNHNTTNWFDAFATFLNNLFGG